MALRKALTGGGEYELMASGHDADNDFSKGDDAPIPHLGLPRASHSLSLIEYLLALLSLLCCSLALLTVFDSRIASILGQVNQLIVLGLLLQLMAICTQRQIQRFLLLAECLWHRTTLQNLESITRMDLTAANTTLWNRIAILLSLTFPIGLGVAYKGFTGGVTISAPSPETGMYGVTGPPGTVGINTQGRLLFMNATLPWWTAPMTDGAFGFNLQVDSASRTAMLDGPTPKYVEGLKSRLQEGQSMILATTVNATVAEMVIDIANTSMKSDLAYWYDNPAANDTSPREATDNFWGNSTAIYSNALNTIGFGLLVPWGDSNSNFLMTSRWNSSRNESFGAVAQGFAIYRQQYRAEWTITNSSITLKSATMVRPGPLLDEDSRRMIGDNWLRLAVIYPAVLAEYDWKYLNNMGFYASHENKPLTIQQQYIKTDTTLVAAMVWSRIATWNGLASPVYEAQLKDGSAWNGTMYPGESTYQIRTLTLKQHPLLAAVLAFNPFISLLIIAIRLTMLRGAPIWVNFGITSLLAAIDPDSKRFLRGAGYSGELKEDVAVRFLVSPSDHAGDGHADEGLTHRRRERIVVKLERMSAIHTEGSVRHTKLVKGVYYE